MTMATLPVRSKRWSRVKSLLPSGPDVFWPVDILACWMGCLRVVMWIVGVALGEKIVVCARVMSVVEILNLAVLTV